MEPDQFQFNPDNCSKSQFIEDLTLAYIRCLHPLGITHLTVYLTGGRDLLSPKYTLLNIPYNGGELVSQIFDVPEGDFPGTIIIKQLI